MVRRPFVAGQFYPDDPDELRRMIVQLAGRPTKTKKALAVVSPHAGYMYSGPVAAALFSSIALPSSVIILGPAHRDIRPVFAIQAEGAWATPLGESPIDRPLAKEVLDRSELVEEDEKAHAWEHSLEVQLPFIQHGRPDASIVPICISHRASAEDLEDLGKALAAAVKASGREVLLVASTDMSHYVSQTTAERKDRLAIDRVLALDPSGLLETVRRERISMCGFQPTASVIWAAVGLGAKKAELVRYQTSGDTTGDFSQVVGYAGIRID